MHTRAAIGVIEIDSPPVNALSQPVRAGLLAAIEQLDADSAVQAIVVQGCGKHFAAGADIREFDSAPRAPLLNDVLLRLESAAKLVIADLHGAVLGGGAEIALASHYRCSRRCLSFGFPEINIGLVPGSGGTVRLPRLSGATAALELMLEGRPIDVDAAAALRLIDRVTHAEDGAFAYAAELLQSRAPIRRTRDLPVPEVSDALFFSGRRASLPPKLRAIPAAAAIVTAIEACCTQPFEAALQSARALSEQCRQSSESRALRHLFFAERGSSALGTARAVQRIGVVGAGTMGRGIALSAALAGYEVVLFDAVPEVLIKASAEIAAIAEEMSRKGWLKGKEAAVVMRQIVPTQEFAALASMDLIIEAVFEEMAIKCELFARLGAMCRAGAVLATNTSTLNVDALAEASARPGDVIGMHFFSPAHRMRLVEIVQAAHTAADVVATALTVSRRLDKVGIVVGNGFAFVGNRMLYAYGRERELLMLEGAAPAQVDRTLESFGMAMGPNAVGDLAGLDVGYRARRAWTERPRDPRFYRVSDLLVESGRLGRKSGSGFYRYGDPHRRGMPDPEVLELIRAEAQRLGITQRTIEDEEILERCLTALINEGGKLLDEGIARSAADIDAIWCGGYGFPRFRGGPMFYAEQLGRDRVRASVEKLARQYGSEYWTPARWLLGSRTQG